jgi:hypothetical protein
VLVVGAAALLGVTIDALSDQPTEALVVAALVFQNLDTAAMHPAIALAAEPAFFERAEAVVQQRLMRVSAKTMP